MTRLLLTGATGFVGRNLLLKEVSRGTRIHVPVRDLPKLYGQLRQEGLDESLIEPLPVDPLKWPQLPFDRAILCAGVLFARNRNEYFETNVKWSTQILEALPPGCETVVLSSQAAGGPTPKNAVARTEEHPDNPLTWYGRSKLAFEERLRDRFSGHNIKIIRPPMVLGARDTATLPLFKMAAGILRIKPGLRPKEYSFIAVDDLVSGIDAAWGTSSIRPLYISSERTITDWELINTVAKSIRSRGVTIPLPQIVVKLCSMLVDSIPALRDAAPSLTRDRIRDIWPDRWVVDSTAFRKATGWSCRLDLSDAIESARDYYAGQGLLR